MEPTVYIGFDSREEIAYQVCKHSIERRASKPVTIRPIKLDELRSKGLYYRTEDPLASTEFTYSRFLVPYLNDYKGPALFIDCDFLFMADIWELFEQYDPKYALSCVHHDYRPTEKTKMDGRPQSVYPRKNWSSMILWNCGHPKHNALTVETVNGQTGAFLHRFQWLDDSEIGEVSYLWNFLEGWYKPTEDIKACHYTRGGPFFPEWQDVDYADEWREEYRLMTGKQFVPPHT